VCAAASAAVKRPCVEGPGGARVATLVPDGAVAGRCVASPGDELVNTLVNSMGSVE
jgi:hypothetical protein